MYPREPSPARLGPNDTSDVSFKSAVLQVSNEFNDTSALHIGLKGNNVPDDKVSLLALEAATARAKSIASAKNVLRHVNGLLQFYMETRNESSAARTGESPAVLILDYVESLAE